MIDREKVIEGQKQVILHLHRMSEVCYDGDVPYYEDLRDKAEDALELLNEQEPKFVLSMRECETLPNHYERKGFCPKCHQVVEWYLNRSYCGFCGQAVKWDAQ